MSTRSSMDTCAYPDCDQTAEFTCLICKKQFCAFHTYQASERSPYLCTEHWQESPAYAASLQRIRQSAELDRLEGGAERKWWQRLFKR